MGHLVNVTGRMSAGTHAGLRLRGRSVGKLGVTSRPLLSSAEPKPRRVPPAGFSLSGVANQMTEYWVFQDKSFKRACIHRSNCSVRQGALNPGRSEGTWHGAYTTYEEARRTAAELSPKKGAQLNCHLCHLQNF